MATPSQRAGGETSAASSSGGTDRRGFLAKAMALACGGVAVLVPLASGLVVLLDPLRRGNALGKLIPVAPAGALPDDGKPREFPVIAERVDAWNRSTQPVGAVYLRRTPGESKIECLSAICPHAGCFINYDASADVFKCPCHNSECALDGAIIEPSPSPRPMDSLQCRQDGDEILVKFEEFYCGRADKVVKG